MGLRRILCRDVRLSTVSLIGLALLAGFFFSSRVYFPCASATASRLSSLLPVVSQSRPPVVVIEGDFVGDGGASSRADARQFADNVRRALGQACVAYEDTTDSTVERWGLPKSCRVAILPYNRCVSAAELVRLRAFMGQGGKVIIFYLGPEELLAAGGVRAGAVVQSDGDGRFSAISLRAGALPALPDRVVQRSWNVRACELLPSSTLVGEWVDASGAPTGFPAVVLGDKGAFISHVFASGDEYRKGQLLRAIIGHFVPSVFPEAVRKELAEVDAVGRFGTLARLREHLQKRRSAGQQVDGPLAAADRAVELADRAREALAQGDALSALEAATEARLSAARAFWMTYPAKPGELRGVWMSYRGRPTWEETMRNLSAAHINAVMPRFCSAGVAYFPSRYLPHAPYMEQHGDQLAQATEAARKYGVPVHARMLALFVYEAPEGVRESYRKAGRLMVSTSGETENWLCPTHPLNREAVAGACLEMARYPVAGIQLDYIRYPWKTYCYCKHCRAKFEQDLGVRVTRWPFDCSEGKYRGRFADWRREQITSLVREIRRRLKEANPGLLLSAAVFVNWEGHRESFGQDWKAWVDEGLLDFVCPMDYFGDDETFASWVAKQRQWTRWETPMCVGIGPRVENVALDPAGVLAQVEVSRRLGADGWALFEYDETLAAEYLPVIAAGVSSTPTEFGVGPPFLLCTAHKQGDRVRLQYRLDTGAALLASTLGAGADALMPAAGAVQEARVSLYTADAWMVRELGPIQPDQPMNCELPLADGAYRLCVQGTRVRQGREGKEVFVRWSPVFEAGS